ncbi:histidinol-phosphate transaminase [Methanobacterium alcaliphilum]|uniref:histidinol-phosphate transaminase n=1 Tax=Methanobacterium alcaliphilum TaxID=392018 RepID=UPI00200ABD3E|nr:histidinol-phosphate transaminase [Methanobacterium alcaliphilum]MCK9151911.1 histidinol-phosphate transaminase [Methanobacterium alcaliphilum]
MVKIRKIINKMDPYIPGRSINEIAKEYNLNKDEIIKLGSNENPLGPSPNALKAIKEQLNTIHQYPESGLEDLKTAIANYSRVSPEQVIIGGDGADEIIEVLGKTFIDPGCEFIVPLPSYMYYEFTLQSHGAVPVYAKWDVEQNQLDVQSVLNSLSEKTRLVFLCTPNNPTGGLISAKDIKTILKSTDALVVVDEAYFEFSLVDNVDLLSDYPNLFIMRTFSKVLGLAGMRIGYGLADPEVIEYMHRVKPVFSLVKLAHVAALSTLNDTEYIKKSQEYSIESREFLYDQMSQIEKLNVFNSKANYILVNVRKTGMNSTEIAQKLLEKGVIVRDCKSFKGLDDYWIRVSVGTLEEDAKFIDILKKLVE